MNPTAQSGAQLSRRAFVKTAALGAVAGATGTVPAATGSGSEKSNGPTLPLKIGHRAASMRMAGDLGVFKLARQIPGLLGVELQVTAGEPNLRDWDAVRRYKSEAHRWGLMVPSLAGVWNRGVSLRSPQAGINLIQSIRAAELLGSSVLLVAFFRHNAPDLEDESSFGPAVELLQGAAKYAGEAGVVLGLENSLSPAGNQKLVDWVGSPQVKVYYDIHNMAFYGHGDQAVAGVKLLGKERICQVHVKNEDKLIEEPGMIDWEAAFRALNEIGYEGWYVFESRHADDRQLQESTSRNIEFMKRVCRMPSV